MIAASIFAMININTYSNYNFSLEITYTFFYTLVLMHIAFFSDSRAVSELRNLEVLNLAMCTGVTITGICSLVKGGKNSRCIFIKKLIMIRKNAF